MTMLQDFRQTVARLVDGSRTRRRLKREIAQLSAMGSLDAVLADAGLARSQIGPLVAGCAGSRALLDQMLERLGIDASRMPTGTMRDMTWTCTTCPHKRQCRRWLAGHEATGFHGFCPNADQLDDALGQPHPVPADPGPSGDSCYPTADDFRRMRAEATRREVRALLNSPL
jgi:hypothetical protein